MNRPKAPKRDIISAGALMAFSALAVLGCFFIMVAVLMVTAP